MDMDDGYRYCGSKFFLHINNKNNKWIIGTRSFIILNFLSVAASIILWFCFLLLFSIKHHFNMDHHLNGTIVDNLKFEWIATYSMTIVCVYLLWMFN